MRTHSPFDRAMHSASAWLTDVAKALGTEDRHFAYRALRAWLHTLRDRLTVDGAAQFAAQLPELLRGLYYDGWDPSRAPIKYGPDEYPLRFAQEARIPIDDVRSVSAGVAGVLRHHLSPGQLQGALAQLPQRLQTVILGQQEGRAAAKSAGGGQEPADSRRDRTVEERVERLEAQVASVAEALRVLAHGLETAPGAEPDERRGPRAARQAYEILLTAPG